MSVAYGFYAEGDSVGSLLETVLQNFEHDRQEYWTDDPDGQRYLEFVDALAIALLNAAEDLSTETDQLDEIQRTSREEGLKEQVRERLEIEIAYTLVGWTKSMAERCLQLTDLVVRERPNATVLKFLRRLSRCYIVGFLPECVILCRGVMENAIKEAFDRRRLALPEDEEGNSTMRQKLNAAVRFNLLSQEGRSDAWLIWERGSIAVHNDPEVTKDVLGNIRMTLGILQELYG